MRYTGSWSVNNGGTYGHGYASNNKNTLAKLMRDICKGSVFEGNTGHWSVCDTKDNSGEPVLGGTIRR